MHFLKGCNEKIEDRGSAKPSPLRLRKIAATAAIPAKCFVSPVPNSWLLIAARPRDANS
jgi:hypothetical protein